MTLHLKVYVFYHRFPSSQYEQPSELTVSPNSSGGGGVTLWQEEPSSLMLRSGSDLVMCPRVFRQPRGGASPRFHDASGHHQHQDGSERGDSGAGMHC